MVLMPNATGQRGPMPDGWLIERVPWRASAESVDTAAQRASVWSSLLGSSDSACHMPARKRKASIRAPAIADEALMIIV